MSKVDYDVTRQMYEDLMSAYCSVSDKVWYQQSAYERAVKCPAPRYYVSAKQAYQVLSKMTRGDMSEVNKMRDARRRMYLSLFEKVLELSDKRQFFGKSLWYIIPFAVNSPAPEFFMSWETIRRIRRWIKQKKFDDEGKVAVKIGFRERAYEKLKASRARV